MDYLLDLGKKAKDAATILNKLSQKEKIKGLYEVSKAIAKHEDYILNANKVDIENAKKNGMKESLIDRLSLDHDRINGMSSGLLDVAELEPTRVWRCIVVRSMPKVNISARSRMAMPYVKHWRYCKRYSPFASAKIVFIAIARVRVCNTR